ncbi:2039_t:CDS:2, partial [Racocetra persica]
YKENPNSIIEASISISAISIPITTIAATTVVASTSTPIPTTIFVTTSTPIFAILLAVTTTTTLATILTTISAPILTTDSIIILPTTTPSPASLELVSTSALNRLQSFISTILSTQNQRRELDKYQHRNSKLQQNSQFRNIARCSLDDFNIELEDGFDLSIWQYKLTLLEPPPLAISQLLTRFDITTGERFVQNIRFYNSAFAFTSLGSLISPSGQPKFAQIYFYDGNFDTQFVLKNKASPNLNLDMMRSLQTELDHINPFVQIFQSARWQTTRNLALKLKFSNVSSQDMRNYNLPVASEIAAIITEDDTINS